MPPSCHRSRRLVRACRAISSLGVPALPLAVPGARHRRTPARARSTPPVADRGRRPPRGWCPGTAPTARGRAPPRSGLPRAAGPGRPGRLRSCSIQSRSRGHSRDQRLVGDLDGGQPVLRVHVEGEQPGLRPPVHDGAGRRQLGAEGAPAGRLARPGRRPPAARTCPAPGTGPRRRGSGTAPRRGRRSPRRGRPARGSPTSAGPRRRCARPARRARTAAPAGPPRRRRVGRPAPRRARGRLPARRGGRVRRRRPRSRRQHRGDRHGGGVDQTAEGLVGQSGLS